MVQSEFNEATRTFSAQRKQCTLFASSGYSPKWLYAEPEETNCWIKFFFVFFSLHRKSVLVASLNSDWTTDGRWTILTMSLLFGHWQWYLLGSQWNSHKPPGFHPKYLKLCSKDELSFYVIGLERYVPNMYCTLCTVFEKHFFFFLH